MQEDNKLNSLYLARTNARIFILGCYLFSSKLTVLLGLRSRMNFSHLGTDDVRGQIFVHVFAPNEGFSLNNLCIQETWLPRDYANKSLPQPVRWKNEFQTNFLALRHGFTQPTNITKVTAKNITRINLWKGKIKVNTLPQCQVTDSWIRKAYDKYCNRQLIFCLWLITYLFRRDWKTNARQN